MKTQSRKVVVFLLPIFILTGLIASSQAEIFKLYRSKLVGLSDNRVWTAAQLEVDLKNFLNTLERTNTEQLSGVDDVIKERLWKELQQDFDIYYSRISVVNAQLVKLKEKNELFESDAQDVATLLIQRERLARIIDKSKTLEDIPISQIRMELTASEELVRRMAINTLSMEVRRAGNEISLLKRHYWRSLLASVLTVALLIASLMFIWSMLKQLRKKYDELAQVTESREQILQNLSHAYAFIDDNGMVVRINRTFEEMLGFEEMKLRDSKLCELILPQKRMENLSVQQQISKIKYLKFGESCRFREIVKRHDGVRFAAEISVVSMNWGRNNRYLVTIRSIAIEQRAMRALRRDRILAEKRAFRNSRVLSLMSHEMRTPLHSVIAALDLLNRKLKSDHEAMELVIAAQKGAMASLYYADNALDIVKLEETSDNMSEEVACPINIALEISEILRPAAQRSGNDLNVFFSDEDKNIGTVKQIPFRHALINLVGNAIKFTAYGSILVTVVFDRTERRYVVEVTDTGAGISDVTLRKIYDNNEFIAPTTHSSYNWSGSGIGLDIFKRMVALLNGTWGVESIEEKGSTFWFVFPALQIIDVNVVTSVKSCSPNVSNPLRGRVLVVDDNDINLSLAGKMLQQLSVEHDLASCGVDAIECCVENTYDVVLVDISMPDMDGYETASAIRNMGVSNDVTILAFTADTTLDKEDMRFVSAGFNDVIFKPLTIEGLKNVLERNPGISIFDSTEHCEPSTIIDCDNISRLIDLAGIDSFRELFSKLLFLASDVQTELQDGCLHDTKNTRKKLHELAGAAGMMGATMLSSRAQKIKNELEAQPDVSVDHLTALTQAVESTQAAYAKTIELFISKV